MVLKLERGPGGPVAAQMVGPPPGFLTQGVWVGPRIAHRLRDGTRSRASFLLVFSPLPAPFAPLVLLSVHPEPG